MKRTKSTFLALLAVLLSPMAANADIIVVDNGTTLTTTWDETFVLTRDMDTLGLVHGIVWDNMFADTFTGGNPSNEIYDIRASVNGGPDIILGPWGGWNYRVGNDANPPLQTTGWGRTDLGILWDPNSLGGALLGDTVRLFGSMTHDKGGFHHLPDFGPTTVSFTTYSGDPKLFAEPKSVAAVPEPGTLALLGIGLLGMGAARRKKKV